MRGRRERHHYAIHKEVDGDAIQNARDRGVINQEPNPTARRKVDGSSAKSDKEMAKKAEKCSRQSAIMRSRT